MLIETGLFAGIIGIGALADLYSTERAKLAVGSWIAQTKNFDWLSFVAQRSWLIYTTIFGSRGASKRFITTSLLIYTVLCVGSLIFLSIFFPSTYLGVTSVWRFGSIGEQIWWTTCLLAGGALYVIANAQTLYFLEILKTAPNLFRFLLVAYADLLITASIALFGIPALLTLQTAGVSLTSSTTLALRVDFSRLTEGPVHQVTREAGDGPERSDAPFTGFFVRFGFQDPARDLAENNADYDAALEAIRRGHMPDVTQGRGGSLLYGTFADFVSVISRGEAYQDFVMPIRLSEDGRSYVTPETFCRTFSSGAINGSRSYTQSPRMNDVAATLLRACLARTSANVEVPVRINMTNLDFGKLYRTYLLITLYSFTNSATASFQSYLAVSPYSLIKIEDPSQMWDVYRSFYSMVGSGPAFDQMVFKAYLRHFGATRLVMNRGLPAGTINFAIMSTALFSVLVMSILFISFPIIKLLSRQDTIRKYITLEKAPFAVLSALFGVWATVLWSILSLF